jgi:hypothetical protein
MTLPRIFARHSRFNMAAPIVYRKVSFVPEGLACLVTPATPALMAR